jgi:hypothetical protein
VLNILIKQPEVDPDKITLIGHSEGTMIIPRLVIDLNNNNNNNNNNTYLNLEFDKGSKYCPYEHSSSEPF